MPSTLDNGCLAASSKRGQRAVDGACRASCRRSQSRRWAQWGPHKRARCLNELARLCREHEKDLARLESLDMGMPYGFARKFSAKSLVRNLEYFAGWADKVYGEIIPGADKDCTGARQSLEFAQSIVDHLDGWTRRADVASSWTR